MLTLSPVQLEVYLFSRRMEVRVVENTHQGAYLELRFISRLARAKYGLLFRKRFLGIDRLRARLNRQFRTDCWNLRLANNLRSLGSALTQWTWRQGWRPLLPIPRNIVSLRRPVSPVSTSTSVISSFPPELFTVRHLNTKSTSHEIQPMRF